MEKSTILARMRFSIRLTQETLVWLDNYPNQWFSRDGGSDFLLEFGGTWREIIESESRKEVSDYFRELGLVSDALPYFQSGQSYKGSWIFDATIAMTGTVGTAYIILKGLSELPQIAEGLTKLRTGIEAKAKPEINRRIKELLEEYAKSGHEVPSKLEHYSKPPSEPATLDFSIDARPLEALSPDITKSHKLALSVAISRSSVSIENLGTEDLSEVRVGLFRTPHERSQWSYADAYSGEFSILSSGQILSKRVAEFVDQKGSKFDLSDNTAIFVDCWVQDISGIYLFRFFLEDEH